MCRNTKGYQQNGLLRENRIQIFSPKTCLHSIVCAIRIIMLFRNLWCNFVSSSPPDYIVKLNVCVCSTYRYHFFTYIDFRLVSLWPTLGPEIHDTEKFESQILLSNANWLVCVWFIDIYFFFVSVVKPKMDCNSCWNKVAFDFDMYDKMSFISLFSSNDCNRKQFHLV